MKDYIIDYIRELASILISAIVLVVLINTVPDISTNILPLFVIPLFIGVVHYGITKVVELC